MRNNYNMCKEHYLNRQRRAENIGYRLLRKLLLDHCHLSISTGKLCEYLTGIDDNMPHALEQAIVSLLNADTNTMEDNIQ